MEYKYPMPDKSIISLSSFAAAPFSQSSSFCLGGAFGSPPSFCCTLLYLVTPFSLYFSNSTPNALAAAGIETAFHPVAARISFGVVPLASISPIMCFFFWPALVLGSALPPSPPPGLVANLPPLSRGCLDSSNWASSLVGTKSAKGSSDPQLISWSSAPLFFKKASTSSGPPLPRCLSPFRFRCSQRFVPLSCLG